jgi:hypothetical protein
VELLHLYEDKIKLTGYLEKRTKSIKYSLLYIITMVSRYSIIILASVGGATLVIIIVLISSVFAKPTKDYAIDIDPIKDNQNLFSTARVTVTNTGKLPLTNIVINYGGTAANAIEKLASLSPGEKVLLSPPDSSALQSVTVTADHGVSITKAYRTPIKIPGMMGS